MDYNRAREILSTDDWSDITQNELKEACKLGAEAIKRLGSINTISSLNYSIDIPSIVITDITNGSEIKRKENRNG